jgi:hypothetical protein
MTATSLVPFTAITANGQVRAREIVRADCMDTATIPLLRVTLIDWFAAAKTLRRVVEDLLHPRLA